MADSKNKRKLVGVYEPGGVEGKDPADMTEDERRAWAEALAAVIFGDVIKMLDEGPHLTTGIGLGLGHYATEEEADYACRLKRGEV